MARIRTAGATGTLNRGHAFGLRVTLIQETIDDCWNVVKRKTNAVFNAIAFNPVAFNPFQAWTDLAWTLGEMSVASAQVVAHRTARMAAAGPTPNARDRTEFTRMGQEKLDAATESAQAMAQQWAGMNASMGGLALRTMMDGSAALLSLASSRNVGQMVARQAKLAQHISRSAVAASELSDATVRLASSGIKPIHARATANARRLAKG